MPRKFIERFIPKPSEIQNNPALKFFGVLNKDPNLFHLNRHSVSVAFFVGLFVAFLPMPGQLFLGTFGALLLRCNLPITLGLIWLSNPLTIPIIFFATYKLGTRILQTPETQISFDLSWSWFENDFLLIWQPLVLGCILASLFFGCGGYLAVQWSWRWNVAQKWKRRKRLRALKAQRAGQ